MKTIGVLFGVENSFPSALVERINSRNVEGIRAEFVETGAVRIDKPSCYAVIVDRISHDIPFYRTFLKHAALHGTAIVNNPFWSSADDKFVNYTLAARLGVAVPPTVVLPHKQLPQGITDKFVRNLEYPLDWESILAYVGEHGFLKPIDGGGWRDVYEVHSRDEFFRAYDASRDLCMMYQKAIDYTQYFRCFVIGQKKVRIMAYDPRRPLMERYLPGPPRASRMLLRHVERDALTLCRALGYDINTVEFAIQRGIPYAIDFMNPVPEADARFIGEASFEWIVNQVADLAIAKAKHAPRAPQLHGAAFLSTSATRTKPTVKKRTTKSKAGTRLPSAPAPASA